METSRRNGIPPWLYLLAFSAGIISHHFLDDLLPWGSLVACIGATVALGYRFVPIRTIAVLLIGLGWANLIAGIVLNNTLDQALEKQDVEVVGNIIGVPTYNPRFTRFDFAVDSLEWKGKSWPAPAKIRLRAFHDRDKYRANQAWRLTVRLKRARSYQNPGTRFNYETYLFQNRIRATGYIREDGFNRIIPESGTTFSISAFRQRIAEFIGSGLGASPLKGMLSALVVGVRSEMDDHQWQVLQRTGTIHLVAISGLHIGLVAGTVMLIFAPVWRMTGQLQLWIPAKVAAATVGLGAGTMYALLAGLTIPTRRALVMLALVVIGIILRRNVGAAHMLLLALGGVLLLDPLSPLSPGFWLSFGAVAILAWWVFRNHFSPVQDGLVVPGIRIAQWIRIQIMLALGLAPLLLVLFGKVSVAAPLANLVAIPVISILVVPPALVALGLAALDLTESAILVFRFALVSLEYLWMFLEWLAQFDWAQWQPSGIPAWLVVCVIPGLLLLFAPPALPARLASVIWLAPLVLYRPPEIEHGAFRFTLLEVGHGLASVVETSNHVLVFDTGPRFPGGFDAGRSVLLPYLESRGLNMIDTVVVSHAHNDHAGGYRFLERSITVRDTISGGVLPGNAWKPCRSGNVWKWDDVEFRVLWPPDTQWTGNNASCVIKVSSAWGSLLLTGDIELDAERILAETFGEALASEAIQVPHQGSRTSSSSKFLSKVRPRIALYSTGYLNRYNHPHREVSARYQQLGASQWNTAEHGAVSVDFTANSNRSITVSSQRSKLRGYWFE